MRNDFVERHRGLWPVRTMCRVPSRLGVCPSLSRRFAIPRSLGAFIERATAVNRPPGLGDRRTNLSPTTTPTDSSSRTRQAPIRAARPDPSRGPFDRRTGDDSRGGAPNQVNGASYHLASPRGGPPSPGAYETPPDPLTPPRPPPRCASGAASPSRSPPASPPTPRGRPWRSTASAPACRSPAAPRPAWRPPSPPR